METKTLNRKRSDRWADWAVIGTLVVALLLGTAVMVMAQNQTSEYTQAEMGLTLHYPQGWLVRPAEGLAFQAFDPESGLAKTTYQVRVAPIQAGEAVSPTLALVLNNLSLGRASTETAYRLFGVTEGAVMDGQPTMEASYVYVAESGDLFKQTVPAVVHGLDIAVARGDQAYTYSLLAEESAFGRAEQEFRRFVQSAEIQP
jgi:hypothetical protein